MRTKTLLTLLGGLAALSCVYAYGKMKGENELLKQQLDDLNDKDDEPIDITEE